MEMKPQVKTPGLESFFVSLNAVNQKILLFLFYSCLLVENSDKGAAYSICTQAKSNFGTIDEEYRQKCKCSIFLVLFRKNLSISPHLWKAYVTKASDKINSKTLSFTPCYDQDYKNKIYQQFFHMRTVKIELENTVHFA